jgi:gliding motility-associated-like protein
VEQNPQTTYTEEGAFVANLVVTDINGCTATMEDTIMVHIVSDAIEEAAAICLGDSLQLNPMGIDPDATYTWSATPSDPTLDIMNPNPMVAPIIPTTYSVRITQGLCTVNYEIAVDIKSGADVALPPDTTVCDPAALTITAQSSNATDFLWSTSPTFNTVFATTQSVEVLPNGTYYVRALTAAECPAMDSITINLANAEIQVVPTDLDICLGEQAALMLSNLNPDQILSYTWSPALPNEPNPIVEPAENTIYTVTVTNQFGCTASLSFNVSVTTTAVDATATPTLVSLNNPTTVLEATTGGNGTIISYEWTPAETLLNPNAPVTEASPTETTLYTITVMTDNGCIATDTVSVNFRFSPCVSPFVFVPNAFTPNGDGRNDYFIVKADGMTELKMIIWNRWGEILYETSDPTTLGWDGTYKGTPLTADSYAWYVWLTCGNGDIYESKGNVTLMK